MKPRLFKRCNRWFCKGLNAWTSAETPQLAYERWATISQHTLKVFKPQPLQQV